MSFKIEINEDTHMALGLGQPYLTIDRLMRRAEVDPESRFIYMTHLEKEQLLKHFENMLGPLDGASPFIVRLFLGKRIKVI